MNFQFCSPPIIQCPRVFRESGQESSFHADPSPPSPGEFQPIYTTAGIEA